jgi:hypothetical protein
MTRLVSDDSNLAHAGRQRIVKWSLWPSSAILFSVAIFASAKAGCGATGGRDLAVFGAAIVTGSATASTLWKALRAWQALAISLVATVIVGEDSASSGLSSGFRTARTKQRAQAPLRNTRPVDRRPSTRSDHSPIFLLSVAQ